jgi:hypothetical protein
MRAARGKGGLRGRQSRDDGSAASPCDGGFSFWIEYVRCKRGDERSKPAHSAKQSGGPGCRTTPLGTAGVWPAGRLRAAVLRAAAPRAASARASLL